MLYRSLIGVVCLLAVTALTSCSPGITSGSSAMGPADTASPSSPVIAEATPSGRQPDQQTAPQTLSPSQDPVAATGVADDTQNAPSTPVPTPSGEPINPLTGLRVSDPSLLARRPLAIKISNYPRDIRPQYGLNLADVVFEYYIEWADTRFIGVFLGNDASQIGPVRSGRYFDEHITRMYHAYYVFNYADPREYNYFLGGDLGRFLVVPGNSDCPPFFQYKVSPLISDVRHYETYFDSTRFGACLARKAADNGAQDLGNSYYSLSPPIGGAEVSRIFTHYSQCDYNYWQYEPATARYLRYQETSSSKDLSHLNDCSDAPETYAPLVDAATQQQVSADNVVVIFVSHTFASQGEEDDEIYHINLIDSGKAYVFRNGLGIPARWTRTDIDQPLLLTTTAGTPVQLSPGRTFYQIIGLTSTDWSEGSDWHFDFRTP